MLSGLKMFVEDFEQTPPPYSQDTMEWLESNGLSPDYIPNRIREGQGYMDECYEAIKHDASKEIYREVFEELQDLQEVLVSEDNDEDTFNVIFQIGKVAHELIVNNNAAEAHKKAKDFYERCYTFHYKSYAKELLNLVKNV